MKCGIVGLPNVGKSTLFNALTSNNIAEASNYPFCTIDPNVGIVELNDPRLGALSQINKSQKVIPAAQEFVDIAGLVAGASKGEGLGNKFLANIRETDAIIHVVRCFESEDVVHVAGKVDPISDAEVINLELALADLQMVENTLPKVEKQAKLKKELRPVVDLLVRIKEHLDDNQPVRLLPFTEEEREILKTYQFLTAKPVIYLANVGEDDLPEMMNDYVKQLIEFAEKEGSVVLPISAKVEEEIVQLPEGEREEFLESMGLHESGLQRLARLAFDTLGLITYLTTGEKETRAWTIKKGTRAPEAAGKIHSDIQQGFICAKVVSYDDYIECEGLGRAKETGKLRSEGKEYLVQDGDVIEFMHHI